MMTATQEIVFVNEVGARTVWRLDEVIDTRSWDFHTGKPDPSTGESVECQCCGKSIVVHAHVYLWHIDEKRTIAAAVIGTACCKKHEIRGCGFSAENKNYWKKKWRV
jgi:hypothetical protein